MKRKPSLLIIFLTVFIDLIGFGIVLPLLPKYSEAYGAQGFMIGVIIASYSVMQFLLAPSWGKLSDRIGRRPVVLISTAGSTLSYVMFALAAWPGLSAKMAMGILLFSRIFAGGCGANVSVASAYIADVTPKDKRSHGMALIGVAFGLGFILGPAIGAVSASLFGLMGPGWVAAVICGANFLLAIFILSESRQPDSERAPERPHLAQWAHTLRSAKLGPLIALYFVSTFCFTCFESTLPLLLGSPGFQADDFKAPQAFVQQLLKGNSPVDRELRGRLSPAAVQALSQANTQDPSALRQLLAKEINPLLKTGSLYAAASWQHVNLHPQTRALVRRPIKRGEMAHLNRLLLQDAFPTMLRRQPFYFDERTLGYIFAYCGFLAALMQGGIGRLVKRFGEPGLIFVSLLIVGGTLAWIPYAGGLAALLLVLGLFSIGSGINRAPTMGLISIFSPAAEQGVNLGVAQSAGTLARILAPIFATVLYAVHAASPYLAAAAISVAGAVLAWWWLLRRSPEPAATATATAP